MKIGATITALSLLSVPALAPASTLLGTQITGAFYDWAAPGVPNTSNNLFTTPSTTVIDPGAEFFAGTSNNSDTFDFSDLSLSFSRVLPGLNGFGGDQFVFTDRAFSGLAISSLVDNLDNGFTAQLVGNTLTLNLAAGPCGVFGGAGCNWTSTLESATIEFAPAASPVPLPAAAWLLASGLLGIGAAVRRRAKT